MTVIIRPTHADVVAMVGFHRCLSVCLSAFPHDISKTDAARLTKLDIEMFRDESWKSFIMGSRGRGH